MDLREIALENGLTVRFAPRSRRYFGDYHKVCLEISCEISLTRELFEDDNSFKDALLKLGKTVSYKRVEEQMGVPTAEIDSCVEKLVEHFNAHALRYFAAPSFPGRLVHAELAKKSRPRRPLMPMHKNG